jgi:hypothetical protein
MNDDKTTQAKTQRPHAYFDEPQEVMIDPTLSKEQKEVVLDTLEQDARQLSVASAEGMADGEPSKLHDVLKAKDSLELSSIVDAYDAVLKDLRFRRRTDATVEKRAAIEQAITALNAVVELSALKSAQGASGSEADGELEPGLSGDIDDEVSREKLDP